jgi:uncharacterized coiled-coil protein SlyX
MDEIKPRIEKLEESHAFNEHESERLSEELRLAFDRIAGLEKRLASLDERLVRLADSIEEPERDPADDVPPHSGRHPSG